MKKITQRNLLANNKYWLDLELRKDIDDYLTLIYCLEKGVGLQAISINNPSMNELLLLNSTLRRFKSNAPIVISGSITEYKNDADGNEDIHESLLYLIDGESKEDLAGVKYMGTDAPTLGGATVFCGGSLSTLNELIRITHNDTTINACVQGGYAGPLLVTAENTLRKFKKRKSVPTWNLNLDIEASMSVLEATNVNCVFVSKDICHDSWISESDIVGGTSFFSKVLKDYFDSIDWSDKKCLHDVLAFMTLTTPNLVSFESVHLKNNYEPKVENKGYIKWWSEPREDDEVFPMISTSFNKELFISTVKDICMR